MVSSVNCEIYFPDLTLRYDILYCNLIYTVSLSEFASEQKVSVVYTCISNQKSNNTGENKIVKV